MACPIVKTESAGVATEGCLIDVQEKRKLNQGSNLREMRTGWPSFHFGICSGSMMAEGGTFLKFKTIMENDRCFQNKKIFYDDIREGKELFKTIRL